jgi:hypothetical protein
MLFVRSPPIPEAALGLWLEIYLGLAQQQPARKVLSNVLWFRLARLSPPKLGGRLQFASPPSTCCQQAIPPARRIEKVEKGKPNTGNESNCAAK